MYTIFIGMATGGTIRSETATSVIGAMDLLKQKGVDVGLSMMVGGYVAHNRNNLVREAKQRNATHLMFIDNDMVFPPASIIRLLDHDKAIVGGYYNTRGNRDSQGNVISTIKPLNDKGEMILDGSVSNFEIPNELFKVGGLGTGFMLIKMPVFDKLPKPYFVAWESENGEHHTEDIQFCMNAREAGFNVWCSPTIKIGHIGTHEY